MIMRTDVTGAETFSEKFLTDIEYVLLPKEVLSKLNIREVINASLQKNEFLLKVKGSSCHSHVYASPDRMKIIDSINSKFIPIFISFLY